MRMTYEDDEHVVDAEVVVPSVVVSRADPRTVIIERGRDRLSRFVDRSIEILTELAEGAENDRVRLAAVESILDRAGLGKSSTTRVEVTQAEHDIAANEARELVERISKQKDKQKGLDPSIETLFVLEGDDDTLPTAGEQVGVVIHTSSTEDSS